jgi:hypothetical protein
MNKRWVTGIMAAISLAAVCPAMAATSASEQETGLTETMEKQMLEFVRHNYPSRMSTAVRGLQNEESTVHKRLAEAVQFLEGFALGPVMLEGRWESTGRGAKYVLLSVVRGVRNYPNATVFFRTYPGFFRPFTVVQVDADGDGKVDEQSTALCKRDKMLRWLAKRFPLSNIFSA